VRITAAEAWPVTMQLAEPYEISCGQYDHTTNVFLRLETDGGILGYGCAAPERVITGETAESTLQRYHQLLEPEVVGSDPLHWARTLARLRELEVPPAALAGVDMALLDLMGKIAGIPLYQLLGGYRDQILTSVTVGILPEAETVERARDLVGQGFLALKIKGGSDVEQDITRLRRVREVVGPRIQLRFDANQGYTPEQARQFLGGVEGLALAVLEQPTPKQMPEALGRLTAETGVAIMADESLMGLRDVFRLGRGELVDMLNVKLMKVGGIAVALDILGAARSARLDIMVGCMDEAALAIAAGLHFALARPGIRYADLDGHLDLIDDPSAGSVLLKDGMLRCTGQPGLGVEVRV
jgi:L-alanine-DL-glutamate epimerase-like enolase superfamily enzyme